MFSPIVVEKIFQEIIITNNYDQIIKFLIFNPSYCNRIDYLEITNDDLFVKIAPFLGLFTNLNTLIIMKCSSNFNITRECPGSLINLIFSDCSGLIEIPKGVTDLYFLERLEINYCDNFRDVTPFIGNLKNLKILTMISNENLKFLRDELGQLEKLEHCNFNANNNLTGIPESISYLKNLSSLSIKFCPSITFISDNFLNKNYDIFTSMTPICTVPQPMEI